VSLSRLIEKNSEILRKEFLSLVFRLGEASWRGRKLVDLLEIRPGFSAWWTGLIAEKCNYDRCPWMEEIIRLQALLLFFRKAGQPKSLHLASARKSLASFLESFCTAKNIAFTWREGRQAIQPFAMKETLRKVVPRPIRALAWLFAYLWEARHLKGIGLAEWRQNRSSLIFISYLFNFNPKAAQQGDFESYYWGKLPEKIKAQGIVTSWLHLWFPKNQMGGGREAVRTIQALNRKEREFRVHATLETFLTSGVVLRSLWQYGKLFWRAAGFPLAKFGPSLGEISIWKMGEQDWKDSLGGAQALATLIRLNLFDRAFRINYKRQTGVYLQENLSWERAMIFSWKSQKQGALIGFPHGSLRFWDLRYFWDIRLIGRAPGTSAPPQPDKIAVNSPVSRRTLRQGGYPSRKLVPVEALRYEDFSRHKNFRCQSTRGRHKKTRLLVLTDFDKKRSERQLEVLQQFLNHNHSQFDITIKPHPASTSVSFCLRCGKSTISHQPLRALLEKTDMVFASNSTTGALDAFSAGLPVVTFLDPSRLNMSPMREIKKAHFASTPEELSRQILALQKTKKRDLAPSALYYLDEHLKGWSDLLGFRKQPAKTGRAEASLGPRNKYRRVEAQGFRYRSENGKILREDETSLGITSIW